MEKQNIILFKDQYVQLTKDTGEVLNGTITEIMEDSLFFQTEFSRSALSLKSVKEIIPIRELQKKQKYASQVKI